MKIATISVYRLELPLNYEYKFSGNRSLSRLDSTIVAVTTDDGVTGWGEACPCGNNYLPNFPGGIRAGINVIAPDLIGENPLHVQRVYDRMDWTLPGHAYVKSALDMACWDILGKVAGLAVCELLGGDYGVPTPIVAGVPAMTPEDTAARIDDFRSWDCRMFSCKLKGDPEADIARMRAILAEARPGETYICDANGGLLTFDAISLVQSLADLDVAIEQPCATIEECHAVRVATGCRMILDEPINTIDDLLQATKNRTGDVFNLKVTRTGGISKLRSLRDLSISLGVPVTIQDAGGTDITRAAIAHLAQSTPPKYRHSVYDPLDWQSLTTSRDAGAVVENGCMSPRQAPGLGVEPALEIIGEPIAVYSAEKSLNPTA